MNDVSQLYSVLAYGLKKFSRPFANLLEPSKFMLFQLADDSKNFLFQS